MTQEEFEVRMRDKFKGEEFCVVHVGEKSEDVSTVKCLECGRRISHKNSYWFHYRKKHVCRECSYKRKDTAANEEKIRTRLCGKATNVNFFMKSRNGIRANQVSFVCAKCGRTNEREVANFLRQKYDCGYCEGSKQAKDTDSFVSEMREKYGEKFSILSEYVDSKTKIAVRCNGCGFIRLVKPPAILEAGVCPKCERKQRKAAKQKVISKEQNISL